MAEYNPKSIDSMFTSILEQQEAQTKTFKELQEAQSEFHTDMFRKYEALDSRHKQTEGVVVEIQSEIKLFKRVVGWCGAALTFAFPFLGKWIFGSTKD